MNVHFDKVMTVLGISKTWTNGIVSKAVSLYEPGPFNGIAFPGSLSLGVYKRLIRVCKTPTAASSSRIFTA